MSKKNHRINAIDELLGIYSASTATVFLLDYGDEVGRRRVRLGYTYSPLRKLLYTYRKTHTHAHILGFMSAHAELAAALWKLFEKERVGKKRFRFHSDFEHMARRMNAIDSYAQPSLRRREGVEVVCLPSEEDTEWAEGCGVKRNPELYVVQCLKTKKPEPRRILAREIRHILGNGQTWSVGALILALGEEWDRHQVAASLNTLTYWKELERVETGFYRLAHIQP